MLYNNAVLIKRDVLYRTVKALVNDDFDSLNRIPVDAAPRDKNNIRCCIHKDRAVLKYRVMAALGFSIEDEENELKLLSEYGEESSSVDISDERFLTVIHDACSSCQLGHHYISDVCVGCMARPCNAVCPKEAIKVVNGRSVIDKALCINCGKCTNVCPYNAIVKVTVPCESSCPVSALKKREDGVAQIDNNKCISCGKCIKSCPFGAIAEKSQISRVIEILKSGESVNALIAPSIVGQLPGELSQIKSIFSKLGYDNVIEVGEVAAEVAVIEANEFIDKDKEFLTSSCCPAYSQCVDKHAISMKPYLSSTPSPMELAGENAKTANPDSINVFIGPCNAKRVEGLKSKVIDYVLTFEELGAHIMAAGLDVMNFDKSPLEISLDGYGFAESGGVLSGITKVLKKENVEISGGVINGIDSKTVKKFKSFEKVLKTYDFLEVMACDGGCLNGPGVIVSPKVSSSALNSLKKL